MDSGCGDGVIGDGEECEVGGLGCDERGCTCLPGYVPTVPPSVNCVPSSGDEDRLKRICGSVSAANESGYVCLSENSTEYLRCALSESVSAMMPCAPGTRCKASTGVFQIYNPCLWEHADYPVILPDDSDSSDEEDDSEENGSELTETQYIPIVCKIRMDIMFVIFIIFIYRQLWRLLRALR